MARKEISEKVALADKAPEQALASTMAASPLDLDNEQGSVAEGAGQAASTGSAPNAHTTPSSDPATGPTMDAADPTNIGSTSDSPHAPDTAVAGPYRQHH